MGDETEFLKLPIEDCCVHKLWKARVHGYTEAAKLFGQAEDEKAPIFNQYVGIIGKFVSDNNAAAQEKGLEAVLLFVQNAHIAGKIVKDVSGTLVNKCIGAPKAKTKDLTIQILLMFIEIEKHEVIQEELLKGMQQKNPKIASSCIATMCSALKEFGPKVIDMKPLIKIFPTIVEDRDKTVRDEAKNLIVEIYRWMGDALKPKLSTLKPVQLSELETEFEKVKKEKALPTRYLRSQQAKQIKIKASNDVEEVEEEDVESEANVIDPLELIEPLNVLTKLPADFYKNIEAKKWVERKDAVEALEKVLDYPKLEKGDYGELVRALMKLVTKDANVVVVGVSVKCIAKLAAGLKKNFQSYAGFVLPQLLEKFKEKKVNVVTPLREAVDAAFVATTLEAIQEDVVASLENKNPSIKAETASFLSRCFSKSTPTTLNKKLLKVFTASLLKTLNEPDPNVRDTSAEALGTAMKVVGEKIIMPFMADVDNLKMTKIKECCEKAVVVKAVVAKPKVEKEAKPVVKKVLTGGAKKAAAAVVKPPINKTTEKEMSQEEVDEKANEMFSEEVVNGFADMAWKTRLESIESFMTTITIIESSELSAQLLVKILAKKPGFKEANVQVLKAKLDALKYVAQTFAVDENLAELFLADLVEKLGDPKNGPLVADILTQLSTTIGLENMSKNVLDLAFEQKSPKVQAEALNWLTQAVREFGASLDIPFVVEKVKKGLNATNAAVRNSAVTLCGVLHGYIGSQLMSLLSSEKPAVLSLITTEIEKNGGENAGGRGGRKGTPDSSPSESSEKADLPDLVTRQDISGKITEELINELGDKNWKVRNEALMTVAGILKDAKSIKSNLGELPPVLAQRLVDSNGNIAKTALEICKTLATAMGPSCKNHVRTFLKGFLLCLGDNKQWVRQAASACITTWSAEAGYKEFFEGEIISDAFKTGSPALRSELWAWLAEILPNCPEKSVSKDELLSCVPHLFTNLEDRSAEVRKAAQLAVLGIMIHVGYQNMMKQAEKLKPSSKTTIVALLDKTRPDLPMKAEPAKPASPPKKDDIPKTGTKSNKIATVKPTIKKKEEDVDLTPLLPINNLKQQRIIDELKLKTLKWNFTLPRAEFVDLLREQMTNAKLNRILITNMFHADFKYHLKAIESLNEELHNTDAIVANLDLILKWMTLRFFDTNPSVLLKGLEYLQNVFDCLIDINFVLSDVEANSFIPYLVLKIGDPKDTVREKVKGIIKQISRLYTPSKLFALIMDGLKSKNARQRTECLDELGILIENVGMSVCTPSPAQALKEMAKQISDRDNSVRNAALNAIVKAYYIEGEKIYKMIGNISDKDSSLLNERIKRASKTRPTICVTPRQPEPISKTKLVVKEDEYDEPEMEMESSPPPRVIPPSPIIEEVKPRNPLNILTKIDDSFLNSPIKMPPGFPEQCKKSVAIKQDGRKRTEVLNTIIEDLRNPRLEVSNAALSNLLHILNTDISLTPDTEQINALFESIVELQATMNMYTFETHGMLLSDTYRLFHKCLDFIFSKKTPTGVAVNSQNLCNLMQGLIITFADNKTSTFPNGGMGKVIQLCLGRIIENSNFTNASCAVVKLLYGVVENQPNDSKMTELVTKCMLKIIVSIKKNPLIIENDLNLDSFLYECHLFFQTFPQHTWVSRANNTPLKAVKTVLLTLVQVKGRDILQHLTLIENPFNAEITLYLKKLIKSQPHMQDSRSKLTKEMSAHLSEIFMKIAHDDTAKEGLLQFYEFKERNPNVDMTYYLAPTSKYFREYVENGLKQIKAEKQRQNGDNGNVETVMGDNTNSSVDSDDSTNLAQYYLDKLKGFYKRNGLPPPECPDFV